MSSLSAVINVTPRTMNSDVVLNSDFGSGAMSTQVTVDLLENNSRRKDFCLLCRPKQIYSKENRGLKKTAAE